MPRIMVSLLPGGLLVVQNQMHLYPSTHPPIRPFLRPYLKPSPPHPQNPSVKSMALPALATTTRKCNQSAHRIPYNDRAAHRAIQRPRSALRKYNQSAEVGTDLCVFITAGPFTKLCAWGRRRVEDMCYERRRAVACVD